jgi:serine phosphatase RsbU (regulator of sigma subunit)/anti-sigma regulatory factor (Ser/Thr protein kinase)
MAPELRPRPSATVASLAARRDEAIATGLRHIHRVLRPDTVTAYLLTADRKSLAAAMAVDTPLAFTLTPGMSADDARYSNAQAYQRGELVESSYADIRRLIGEEPALVQFMPAPMAAVSVPLRTARHRFGTVTLRWGPQREVTPDERRFLREAAHDVSVELERLAGEGATMTAPLVPVFVSRTAGRMAPDATHDAAAGPAGPGDRWSGSTSFLYRFQRLATELTAAVGPLDIIATVQRQVVRPFGGRAVVLLLAENGRLRIAASAGFSKEYRNAVDGLLLEHHAPETDAAAHVVPLLFESGDRLRAAYPDGRSVGCCAVLGDGPRLLANEELAVLMSMLGQVAQSLQRSRSHEAEHRLAQSTQRSLLPGSLPHLEALVATGRYLPAAQDAEVGGDWYDMIKLPDGRVGLLIGDVEGHSLEAAAVMGQLRSALRAYAGEGHELPVVLDRANSLLAGLDTDLFATYCGIWLDSETGRADIASAGHPIPVLTDAGGHAVVPSVPIGPPLSVAPGAVYARHRITLRPGTVVTLYTDGLVGGGGRGTDRLLRRLAEKTGADLEFLADELVADTGDEAHRADDVALLLMRYEGLDEMCRARIARVAIQRHDLQEVGHLRRFLRDTLHGWELTALMDELELLVTEVVTNSLVHADTDVDVRLRRYPDRVRVDVRDSDPRPPVVVAVVDPERPDFADAESGRGMLIVDAVASSWGSSPSGRGKTTWFELRSVA